MRWNRKWISGNISDAKTIAKNIRENEEKINHHGKRADAIVKGMLQHSRSSTGVKESTEINALADEYLRLSYQGLRAKDKSFNATMKTDYDRSIGNINIIPQDIGRVFLNLYNNAFYAVSEKKKQLSNGYEPTVAVSTKKLNDKMEIRVKDNGNGMSRKVKDKIFQPFFTTKPTGQGTGLGLSLSYDIIKAHGGEIKVETRKESLLNLWFKFRWYRNILDTNPSLIPRKSTGISTRYFLYLVYSGVSKFSQLVLELLKTKPSTVRSNRSYHRLYRMVILTT